MRDSGPCHTMLVRRAETPWPACYVLDLVQLHLFLTIQLSVVILETHTVWIRLISTKDGKMETSRIRLETKTVQILLWPGRRPSFHFNHFETKLLKLFWFSPSLELHVLTGYIFFIFYWNSSREAHMKCIHRPSTWTLSREAHIECTHRPSTWIPVFIFSSSLCPDFVHLHLFHMIQLSVVILETHTVWIRLISTKE